ncbi:MAG: bile acid:sodium symporter [Planctomycetales bacterium]
MLVDVGVPLLVLTSMFVVGTELTAQDFRRVVREPGTIVVATLAQFLLLPLIAWGLVSCLPMQPAIAQGLLLVATCPSGSMANVYSYLARFNVALSVTLTAVSCLAALVMTPLALAMIQTGVGEANRLSVPQGVLARQLIALLILPVLCGMGLRRWWPDFTQRHGRTLLRISIAALALLLLAIIVRESQQFAGALPEIAAAASLFTVLAFTVGYATGWACGANATNRLSLGMVFVVRNVGIATAIAVTVLGQLEFAVFATAYFLVQVPILLPTVLMFRRAPVGDATTS